MRADSTIAPAPPGNRRGRRPIHVAFFLDGMAVGGTELNAVRTAERLDRERFQLSVFCHRPEGPLLERYGAAGVPVIATPVDGFASLSAIRQARHVSRLLREMEVDIVHCHDLYSNIFGAACGRLARGPAVLTSRRWWANIPQRSLREANRLAYRASHGVLANSPAVGRLVADTEGVAPERVAVVTNFVDEGAFDLLPQAGRRALLAELGVPDGALVVGSVANLRPVKDHASLLHAMARLEGQSSSFVHLVLVGDGPCRAELSTLASELGIAPRVHFAGQRAGHPNLHQLFDVSVLCSLQEGFPNTVVEAMAAGRPVVATAVGGVPDAVDDGTTGLLVPARDPQALAAALDELLDSPDRRQAMGEQARARASAQYRASEVLPRLEELYQGLASRARRVGP